MAAGFVSGGTVEEPTKRDKEWLRAQQELEAERERKAEEGKQAGGQSLYEILQRNKAAKQEAFEESIRLKNQFRSLDEDEVEFLDTVLESTRAKEAALKKETMEQLEIFHRQRQEVDKAFLEGANSGQGAGANLLGAGSVAVEEEQWITTGRKRRRGKDKDSFPGVKLRKPSSMDAKPTTTGDTKPPRTAKTGETPAPKSSEPVVEAVIRTCSLKPQGPQFPGPSATSTLGLGAYSSDED